MGFPEICLHPERTTCCTTPQGSPQLRVAEIAKQINSEYAVRKSFCGLSLSLSLRLHTSLHKCCSWFQFLQPSAAFLYCGPLSVCVQCTVLKVRPKNSNPYKSEFSGHPEADGSTKLRVMFICSCVHVPCPSNVRSCLCLRTAGAEPPFAAQVRGDPHGFKGRPVRVRWEQKEGRFGIKAVGEASLKKRSHYSCGL